MHLVDDTTVGRLPVALVSPILSVKFWYPRTVAAKVVEQIPVIFFDLRRD
jgi:hypothetical protein